MKQNTDDEQFTQLMILVVAKLYDLLMKVRRENEELRDRISQLSKFPPAA